MHDDRQSAVVGCGLEDRLDAGSLSRPRSQLTDASVAASNKLFPDDRGNLVGRQIEVDLAEAHEAVGVRGDRGIEFLPGRDVRRTAAGAAADSLGQDAEFASEARKIGGALGMWPCAEQHSPVHVGLVEQGNVSLNWIVDMAVGVDDQLILLIRRNVTVRIKG
ncbi:hypothetical protein AB0L70_11455 [Kribbella sp. NPDC051952]|uniref:hypothetical protein n=1 Tax=Kribbella sp. NPDC051952 TaxID=3154851 RepID=UPI0034325D7E